MDGTRFDAWTRRRFGLVASGVVTSFLGLVTLDDIEAKKKRKRKKKKKKKANICAGKNNCQSVATCHRASAEVQCFCFVSAETGKPFCSIGMLLRDDCSECTKGQTCVDASGGRCGAFPVGCADPCPEPL